MKESFSEILAYGGKTNSLGRASEVVDIVLSDRSQLEALYRCIFEDDAWLRMRAIDSFEKVCRQHPDWIKPYIDRMFDDLAQSAQPSIKWHLAQIFGQVELNNAQKRKALSWLESQVTTVEVDWIVAANVMDTLYQFQRSGEYPKDKLNAMLKIQQHHHSKSVVKKATKLLTELI